MPKGKTGRSKVTKASKKAKTRRKKSARFSEIPEGFGTVTPYLVVNGASDAIEFYKKAFGAKEISRQPLPNGKLMHARIKIGDSTVLLCDEMEGANVKAPTSVNTSTVTIHLYSKDADGLFQRAIDAGARVEMPIDNMFWGERYGQVSDPFGHHWSISKRVKMSGEEMEKKQREAMAMFSGSAQPETPSPATSSMSS